MASGANNINIFGPLNDDLATAEKAEKAANTNTNNNLRPPYSPVSRNSRGRASAFSENNLNLNDESGPAGAAGASAAAATGLEREKLKESFLNNFWRIINLFLTDDEVLKHINQLSNKVFGIITIPGKSSNKISTSRNILASNLSVVPRDYINTRKVLTKLLNELSKTYDLNKLTMDEFFEKVFGLSTEEVERRLKYLHPTKSVLLNNGSYSESFIQLPPRFYQAIKDFYNYGDEFLEFRSTTDVLSRKILNYTSLKLNPKGIFYIISSAKGEEVDLPPETNEIVNEYIVIDSEKNPLMFREPPHFLFTI